MEFLIGTVALCLVFMAHNHFKAEKLKREAEERRRIWRNKKDAATNLLQRMGYEDSGVTAEPDGRLSYGFNKHIALLNNLSTTT